MRFGNTLGEQKYEPWKSNYIDYAKLKKLLREDETQDGKSREWTEDDESKFVEELVNVQLDKVNDFEDETFKVLRERTTDCETRLKEFEDVNEFTDKEGLDQILKNLDSITKEINELSKYSRLNYSGFLKIAKKHDRRRGLNYKVRPLLQVRLAALPFNSEDYSPLLYRCVHCIQTQGDLA